MLAGSLREKPGNRRGEKAGRSCAADNAGEAPASYSRLCAAGFEKNRLLHGPYRRAGPKGQAALEYYLLLAGIAITVLVALSWSSGFSWQQKEANAGVFSAVSGAINRTFAGIGGAQAVNSSQSGGDALLSVSIRDYSPYWLGQPSVFKVELFSSGAAAGNIGSLRVRVRDQSGADMRVFPDWPENFAVPFSYSASFSFIPNATGIYEIEVSAHDEYGEILVGRNGTPIRAVKCAPVIG